MLSRRMFLASTAAAALTLHPASKLLAVPQASMQDMNVDILVDVVKNFLRRVETDGGANAYWKLLRDWYLEWSDISDLETRVVEKVREIYADPGFMEIKKEYGSILYEDGRMRHFAQILFVERFPMCLDYAGNKQTFQTFAAFAPAHLL